MAGSESTTTFPDLIEAVEERLPRNKRLRRDLPGGGRLRIDRQLPFLCVYRAPSDREDAGTSELVTTEAAYLLARGCGDHHDSLAELCRRIGDILHEHFGVFLLLEIWSDAEIGSDISRPAFRICRLERGAAPEAMSEFQSGFQEVILNRQSASVELCSVQAVAPPGLPPLEFESAGATGGYYHFGIAVRPIYRAQTDGEVYPLVLHSLRQQFATALRKSVFAFTNRDSRDPPPHFHSLGPSSLVKAARIVDQQLIDVSESFDFLLQVTPINADEAWEEFENSGFQHPPAFRYRPLPHHPSLLKRRLYEIPLEEVEDATLAHIFWEKQIELDRHISGLRNIGTPEFRYDSLHLYGTPDEDIVKLAKQILGDVPREQAASNKRVTAREIAKRAHEHFDYYHQRLSGFNARVEVSDGIASGIMVSQDCLHVSKTARFRRSRVEPLLHHEIGTHLLTYFNGRQQRLRQLYAGLAGYEALQEGLAVLAEYLAGGLTPSRLRTLAGRVIAVQAMIDGISFVETFHRLREDHGFAAASAFKTTMRAFRGGGLTKDAIYLRGLRDLLGYLARGHDVEPLYVGKIALEHVPIVQQLRRSGIIRAPAILPRLWDQEGIEERLEACRGRSVLDLLETDQ